MTTHSEFDPAAVAARAAELDALAELYADASAEADGTADEDTLRAVEYGRGYHDAIRAVWEWIAGPDTDGRGLGLDRVAHEVEMYLDAAEHEDTAEDLRRIAGIR